LIAEFTIVKKFVIQADNSKNYVAGISDVTLQLSEQLFDRIGQSLTAIQPRIKGIPSEIMTLASYAPHHAAT
jgi:hypothetical protein